MKIPVERFRQLAEAMDQRIQMDRKVSWTEIREALIEKFEISNWMEPRAVLQFMLDEKWIERLPGVEREEYRQL